MLIPEDGGFGACIYEGSRVGIRVLGALPRSAEAADIDPALHPSPHSKRPDLSLTPS